MLFLVIGYIFYQIMFSMEAFKTLAFQKTSCVRFFGDSHLDMNLVIFNSFLTLKVNYWIRTALDAACPSLFLEFKFFNSNSFFNRPPVSGYRGRNLVSSLTDSQHLCFSTASRICLLFDLSHPFAKSLPICSSPLALKCSNLILAQVSYTKIYRIRKYSTQISNLPWLELIV